MLGFLRAERDLTPLRRPVFTLAVLLLVLNDHWLKGAELLPGWFTGKLSDVVGLIVAPILLASLLGFRNRPARGMAFLAVAGVFAAINVSSGAARAVEGLTAWVGFPWQIWCDPTDLLALSVLPLSWWLLEREPERANQGNQVVGRFAVAVAGLACMGTSVVGGPVAATNLTSAYVLNDTGAPLEVQVRWLAGEFDCQRPLDLTEALSFESFEEPVFFTLDHLQTLPLSDVGGSYPRGLRNRRCDVALVSTPELEPRILVWQENPQPIRASFDPADDPGVTDPNTHETPVTRTSEYRVFNEAGTHAFTTLNLTTTEFRRDARSTCELEGVAAEWSELREPVVVTAVLPSVAGCGAVEVQHQYTVSAEPFVFHYCVPGDTFTLEVGDELGAQGDRLTRKRGAALLMEVLRGDRADSFAQVTPTPTFDASAEPAFSCRARTECGAYVEYGSMTFHDHEVFPGDSATIRSATDGSLLTLYVERQVDVLVSNPDCSGSEMLGNNSSVVVIRDHTHPEEPVQTPEPSEPDPGA